MPKSIVPIILACAGFLLLSAVPAVRAADTGYQPFPNGYGYMDPQEIARLQAAVTQGDTAMVRNHGWNLWAGIMQPAVDGSGWPLWFTWPNTTAAFANCPTCAGAAAASHPGRSMLAADAANGNTSPVNVPHLPLYPVPAEVKTSYPDATSKCVSPGNPYNICDGAHFQFNGDIMIPTESLSLEEFDWIRDPKAPLYLQSTLDKLHAQGAHQLAGPQRSIVTKHMFWPVKKDGLTALPVWRDLYKDSDPNYVGYEKWLQRVAIDPTGRQIGHIAKVSFPYGVQTWDGKPWPTRTSKALVYGLKDFYFHQVSQADWNSFDQADKAILDAASWWASGRAFAVGDYLVTVAMHINTREIPSWALQSVWWSDQPTAGQYAADRPSLPQAKGPWRHYLLVDAYGIPKKDNPQELPRGTNPYIELVSHPVGTNCNNCHIRAGWPKSPPTPTPGTASYQNPDCNDLLAKLSPNQACLQSLTLTDFQWIVPDRAQ